MSLMRILPVASVETARMIHSRQTLLGGVEERWWRGSIPVSREILPGSTGRHQTLQTTTQLSSGHQIPVLAPSRLLPYSETGGHTENSIWIFLALELQAEINCIVLIFVSKHDRRSCEGNILY